MEFLSSNIGLVGLVLLSGAMLVWPEVERLLSGGSAIGTLQTTQLINQRHAVVVDVREAAEYNAGHIPGARHLPKEGLDAKIAELGRFKGKPVVLVGKGGNSAATALRSLRKQGFTEVYQLKGGFAAWVEASLPQHKGSLKESAS